MKRVLIALHLLIYPSAELSAETFYYGSTKKSIDISDVDKTVMILPSPPLSIGCQPASVVTFESPSAISAIEQNLPPAKRTEFSNKRKNPNFAAKGTDFLVASTVIVNPIEPSRSTHCSMYLANKDKIDLKLILRKGVFRPLISIKPDTKVTPIDRFKGSNFDQLDLLRLVLKSRKPSNLKEVDTEKGVILSTDSAEYRFIYSAENAVGKVWIVEGKGKKDFMLHRFLYRGNPKVGPIKYSAIRSGERDKPFDISTGETFTIYIVANKGTIVDDIKRGFQ